MKMLEVGVSFTISVTANVNAVVAADWFELTNKGTSAVNITGWKFDDNSNSFASAVALSGITSIGAGESVIFIEGATVNTNFRPNWFGVNPPASLQIGNYTGTGVGLSTAGDAVNIYNDTGVLQANVVFGISPKYFEKSWSLCFRANNRFNARRLDFIYLF